MFCKKYPYMFNTNRLNSNNMTPTENTIDKYKSATDENKTLKDREEVLNQKYKKAIEYSTKLTSETETKERKIEELELFLKELRGKVPGTLNI